MGGNRNDNISHIPFNEEARNRSIYEDILRKSSQQSRIIAICASNIIVRDIMITADNLGMLDSGDYVFINVDLFSSNLERPWQVIRPCICKTKPWFNLFLFQEPGASEEENEIARRAFENVLTISSSKSVNGNFNQFREQFKRGTSSKLQKKFPAPKFAIGIK